VIHVDDFASVAELATYLGEVANNKSLYDSYHAWRNQPLPESFQEKYEFTKVHSYCRMCRLVYAKKYGWGWNPETQTIRDLQIPRQTCLDEQGLIVRPFQERWTLPKGGNIVTAALGRALKETFDCAFDEGVQTIEINQGSWSRTVWDHDGVTDMDISGNGEEPLLLTLNLHLKTDVRKLQIDHQRYWLQDESSRFTFLFSEPVELSKRGILNGVVEIPVATLMKIRIIMEDVDTFHEGALDQETYFGKVMTEDFYNPLEVHAVWQ
jgi:hypothetical protein